MQKKTKKPPIKPKKKDDQPFSLKRLIMGEEKPDLTEVRAGSTTVLDILSPTTIDTKSRDCIVVDGIFHVLFGRLYPFGQCSGTVKKRVHIVNVPFQHHCLSYLFADTDTPGSQGDAAPGIFVLT